MTGEHTYESDVAEQPEALRALAAQPLPDDIASLALDSYDRIILTGMGASHDAAHRTWRALAARGRPAWWVTTSELLRLPQLVTPGSLLWVTSQSGASGEVVALLDELGSPRPTILATTNDRESALAHAADVVTLLHCGSEATVSTKSYVTTLAVHERIVAALTKGSDQHCVEDVLLAADALEQFAPDLGPFSARAFAGPDPRLALIAAHAEGPSALVGALVLKEAAKVSAEAFLGGEFRHGPLEIAGPGCSAIFYLSGEPDEALDALSRDLVATGANVLRLDGETPVGGESLTTGTPSELGRLCCGAKLAQLLSIELAKARGIVPGVFRFGRKVTGLL